MRLRLGGRRSRVDWRLSSAIIEYGGNDLQSGALAQLGERPAFGGEVIGSKLKKMRSMIVA